MENYKIFTTRRGESFNIEDVVDIKQILLGEDCTIYLKGGKKIKITFIEKGNLQMRLARLQIQNNQL